MSRSSPIQELERIELDDALHDFGGAHGSKGHDFAAFWIIFRLTELEARKQGDYAFICEYVQDVAELDSASQPSFVRLYQLKKKEDGYWKPTALTGQAVRSKKPKLDKPLCKLLAHVRAFKVTKAAGSFVTNAKFEVPLATGHSSVNEPRIGLHHLDNAYTAALRRAVAEAEGVRAEDVDLTLVELRSEPIAVNDLQRHANGVMIELLQEVAPAHAGQAASLVETLNARIKARARRTEKCGTWSELLERRGFSRATFQDAVEQLKCVPDKTAARLRLLDKLSGAWNMPTRMRVEAALTKCAMSRVLIGESSHWRAIDLLLPVFEIANSENWTDQECFEAACNLLIGSRPELDADEVRALTIYEMTEWALDQVSA